MLDQTKLFQLLSAKKIYTVSKLASLLGVNYYALRNQLNSGNLRLDLAVKISNFLDVPVNSFCSYHSFRYIKCVSRGKKDVFFDVSDLQTISYIMFCILSQEEL